MERIPRGLEICLLAAVLGASEMSFAQEREDRVAPIPGRQRERGPRRNGAAAGFTTAVFPFEFRTIDGAGNHPTQSERGAAGIELLRIVQPAYADESDAPAGADRPNVRELSRALSAQSGSIPNDRGASDLLWQWGQFLDHDIDETPTVDPPEAFDIEVPLGDPWFDPAATGIETIPLNRSAYHRLDGVRQQLNEITAFIDASNVYGSDEERARALRTLDGTGRLRTSTGALLPYNTTGLANAPSANIPTFFLAGDVRANEQVYLSAMHTLFLREHNYWATALHAASPQLGGDLIYELVRAIVGAEIQAISYSEFLPVLLGRDALPPYRGYDPSVDPGISNLFATAAYRVGHTMLSETLLRLDATGDSIPEGSLGLAEAFFRPELLTRHGIEPYLRGLAAQRAQEIDTRVVDAVRNFLFGPPGSGGFDLVSLNLQRGRDHGLPALPEVRRAYDLPRLEGFRQLHPNRARARELADAYGSVDRIDPWMGMLAEAHVPGTMVGPTMRAVLADQFRRLRDGDRFWYQSYMPPEWAHWIESQTLATIVRRNSSIGSEFPDRPFTIERGR